MVLINEEPPRDLTLVNVILFAYGYALQSVDFFTLWAEETLIEDNLVLDILFLAYYESFCTCNGKQWKKLCLLYEVRCSIIGINSDFFSTCF